MTSLIYGPDDRLIFMGQDNHDYYVVTDRNGSPLLILTPDGTIVKEITRTPYGEVTYDSNQNLEVPIGFQGGFYDVLVKFVHFQVTILFRLSSSVSNPYMLHVAIIFCLFFLILSNVSF